jgi:Histidine phosphatase superfamily (branch 2)
LKSDVVAFQSPTGRAVGIGWANEFISRLTSVPPNSSQVITNQNTTLGDNARTFPVNQTLYFDFTHDTNIMGVITALGLTQFAQFLPATGPPPNQQLVVSQMEPFGARMVMEKIECSAPVSQDRSVPLNSTGSATTYIHMLLNQRTVPLGLSYSACENRTDGWCEYGAYLHR